MKVSEWTQEISPRPFLVLGRVDICGIIVICPHSPYLIHNGQK